MVLQTLDPSSKLAVLSRWYKHQDPGWKPVVIAFLHRLGLSPTRSLRAGLLQILDLDRELERWAGDIKSSFYAKTTTRKKWVFYLWDTYRFDIIPLGDRSSTVLNATTIIIKLIKSQFFLLEYRPQVVIKFLITAQVNISVSLIDQLCR